MSLDFSSLYSLYRSELLDRTVPFWLKYGVDWKNGGISTCISDTGEVLSEDKYMWSQLRALWTFSTLYNKVERRKEWLDVAEHIYDFVRKY
ncbi:MAG: AGE family epimerase/isomerase, partial [Acidobacteriota bacterium]